MSGARIHIASSRINARMTAIWITDAWSRPWGAPTDVFVGAPHGRDSCSAHRAERGADLDQHLRIVDRRRHGVVAAVGDKSEEHKSELTSLMRTTYALFCLQKKKKK